MARRGMRHVIPARKGETSASNEDIVRELLQRYGQHERALADLARLLATFGVPPPRWLDRATEAAGPAQKTVKTPYAGGIARSRKQAAVSLKKIVAAVSEAYDVSVAELKSNSREHRVARPRLVAMYLAYKLSGRSKEQIGAYLGGRGPAAVTNAWGVVRSMSRTDLKIEQLTVALRR